MRSLPKIQPITSGSSYIHNEGEIPFFRGEHPDTRSDKEFLRMIEKKFNPQKYWYPGPGKRASNSILLKCLNNGKEYASIKAVREDLGIDTINIAKHLRGEYSHISGYRFKRLL
jgi:hypothetical protein